MSEQASLSKNCEPSVRSVLRQPQIWKRNANHDCNKTLSTLVRKGWYATDGRGRGVAGRKNISAAPRERNSAI
ncbi:MAG: hypothetical protein FWC97_10505 [Treponema sp.]|nr:hypothetical protein [Treponema sp.]